MSLVLPQPARPATGAAAHARAFRHWQAGQCHAREQRWRAAAQAYAQASAAHDDGAFALAAADALLRCGRAAEAAQRAHDWRRRCPDQLLGYTLEARALLESGQPQDALHALRAAPPGVAPDHPYLATLGLVLQQLRQHGDAIAVLLQALALKMDDALLHYHLGTSFREQGLKAEAAECLRTAVLLGLGSSDLAARGQLLFLEREACRWDRAEAELACLQRDLKTLGERQPAETSAFTHAVLVADPAEQLKVARHYALHVARKVRPLSRSAPRRNDGERLKVAYLSADFHSHATSQLLVQTLESHDRTRFEIFCVSTGPDDHSPLRRRVGQAVEHFVDLHGRGHEAVARQVRALGIDLLIDLKGATYDTLMPVLARRPAPLQATWLGYPGSSGAEFIDYVIGDPVVTPLAHAGHFSERIAQLPLCYQPNDAQRARAQPTTRAEWGLRDDALVLCAFHQSYKISAEVFDTWCDLLARRPDAVLWLLQWNANVREALCAAARARGIDDSRLVFAALLPLQQHLSRLACADLFLDTWPCNAHTTAGEALWVGVPVVTLIGEAFAQRVAASLLAAVRLDPLVCRSVDDYRERVLALADDPVERTRLREHLAGQRDASALFDGRQMAADLEALWLRMWQRSAQGLPPAPLPAAAHAEVRP